MKKLRKEECAASAAEKKAECKSKNGKKTRKVIACAAAAVLVCGTMSAVAYGAGKGNGNGGGVSSAASAVEQMFDRAAAQARAANPAPSQTGNGTDASDAAVRDETVYVIAAPDGSVQKIIASDWLVKENGESVYQKAETEGELPVSVRITFFLDGREIKPEEAAGANGRMTIRFDYENHCSRTVEIGDRQEKMYVPFAVMTGVILDGEKVSNVEITNGRLLNDGDRIIAAGLALPGLSENLRRENDEAEVRTDTDSQDRSLREEIEDMDIPEYVEITADVKNFELEATYTIVTNEIFNEIDTEKLLETDRLQEDLDELEDAMAQLIDGADELYDGVSTLDEKSGQLVDGVNRLYDGSSELAEGASRLQDGAGELYEGAGELYAGAGELYAGAGELASGLFQLQANSDALTGGARQVFDTLLSTASGQLAAAGLDVGTLTADNYGNVLDGALASLNAEEIYNQAYAAAKGKVEEAVRSQSDVIRGAVEEQVREAVLAQVLQTAGQQAGVEIPADQYKELAGRTAEEYQQMIAAGLIPEAFPAVIQLISDTTAAQMASEEIQDRIQAAAEQQIQSLIAEKLQSEEVMSQVQAAVESAQAGAGQIAALKSQLDSYQTFYQGILAYTAGVAQAADGASRLCDGASRLQGGVSSLKDGAGQLAQGTEALVSGASQVQEGIGTLKDGGSALTDGVNRLKDGAGKLADGLREFDEEGISKLTRMFREDLLEMIDRLNATTELSKQYLPFGKENPTGEDAENVRFLYKTEAVK